MDSERRVCLLLSVCARLWIRLTELDILLGHAASQDNIAGWADICVPGVFTLEHIQWKPKAPEYACHDRCIQWEKGFAGMSESRTWYMEQHHQTSLFGYWGTTQPPHAAIRDERHVKGKCTDAMWICRISEMRTQPHIWIHALMFHLPGTFNAFFETYIRRADSQACLNPEPDIWNKYTRQAYWDTEEPRSLRMQQCSMSTT